MNCEQLAVLNDIQAQIGWLVMFIGTATLLYMITGALRLRSAFAVATDKEFGHKAERYFEEGRLEALTELCEQRLKSRPNSVEALWWCARGHYGLQHYAVAQERFAKLAQIEPRWQEDVSPYLERINSQAQTVQ
ncbi:MAG: hypothetical protein AAFV45_02760 [Pseudomonadota bacterium]